MIGPKRNIKQHVENEFSLSAAEELLKNATELGKFLEHAQVEEKNLKWSVISK